MRISHSSKTTLKQCGEKYRLHYIRKLRSPKLFSALFFGGALDEAFSRMLLDKKLMKTPEEEELLQFSPAEIFYKKMERVENNGKTIEAAKSTYADYYSSDFSPELLTAEAVEKLSEFAPDVANSTDAKIAKENFLAFMDECKAVVKAKKKLSLEDLALFNYVTWLTLVEKGYLMLEAYKTQIMPQIFEVYSIQERITLPNEAGDEITGLIDFTCSFVDEPGTMYVCDNKTSSKPYKASETSLSEQLATYCEFKQTTKAAYVVIEKKIYAKIPKIHTQILRDDITEATFAETFAHFEEALYSISTGDFEQNFKSCFDYGRLCPYFALCKHNNAEGLVDVSEV